MPQTFSPPEAELAYQILGLAFALFVWIMAFSEWQRTHNRDYYVVGLAFTIWVIRLLFPYIFFAISYFTSRPVSRSFSILVTGAWENLSFAILAGVVIIRMARSHLKFEKILITYFGFIFLLALEIIVFDRLLPFRDLLIWTPFLFTILNIIILSFAIASCYALKGSIIHFYRKAFWFFYVHQVVVFFFYFDKSSYVFRYLGDVLPILGASFIVLAVYTSIRDEIDNKSKRLKELDATKSRFMAVVSHELRTPLSSMKISYDLLLSGKLGELSPKQTEAMSVIKNNSDRLIRMIEELLDISRIERGAFSLHLNKADLVQFAKARIDEAKRSLLKRSSEIVAKFPDKPILMQFDSDKVSQVIINLIHNADRFNREQGQLRFSLSEDKTFAIFDVEDQGTGIPVKQRSRIFDSFVRGGHDSARADGLGLGLHIARQIVEAHGGSISVAESGPKGTRIRFTLSKAFGNEMPHDSEKEGSE
ncbi:MAG: hypothetical protein JW941_08815 [Candidatus Coatesbacteria bacterium]|nr:hypothetical protein [Candidatus Coatesbacteria bacterium]